MPRASPERTICASSRPWLSYQYFPAVPKRGSVLPAPALTRATSRVYAAAAEPTSLCSAAASLWLKLQLESHAPPDRVVGVVLFGQYLPDCHGIEDLPRTWGYDVGVHHDPSGRNVELHFGPTETWACCTAGLCRARELGLGEAQDKLATARITRTPSRPRQLSPCGLTSQPRAMAPSLTPQR